MLHAVICVIFASSANPRFLKESDSVASETEDVGSTTLKCIQNEILTSKLRLSYNFSWVYMDS